MNKSIEKQKGFGLIEISLILMLFGAILLFWTIAPGQTQQQRIQQQQASLKAADDQLIGFIDMHGRLPCPDSDHDGLENCNVAKGTLPYKTIGLDLTGFSADEPLLAYGVYRNNSNVPSSDADLAAVVNRFQPSPFNIPELAIPSTIFSSYDFCAALANAEGSGTSSAFTFVENKEGQKFNVAYALAAPGMFDADDQQGLFDGLNSQPTAGFEMPGRLFRPDQYDDLVISRSFAEIYQQLHCDLGLAAANMAATAADVYHYNDDEFDNLQGNAQLALDMAITGVSLGAVNTFNNTFQAINAGTTIAESSALLANASLLCAILIGCPMVPLYTTSLGFAIAGATLSVTAVAADITAIGLEAGALEHYRRVAQKAGIAVDSKKVRRSTGQPDYWDTLIISLVEQQQRLIHGDPEKNRKYPCIKSVTDPNGNPINNYQNCSDEDLSELDGLYAADERYIRAKSAASHADQEVISLINEFQSVASAIGAYPDETREVVLFPVELQAQINSFLQSDLLYMEEKAKLNALKQACEQCPNPNVDTWQTITHEDQNGNEITTEVLQKACPTNYPDTPPYTPTACEDYEQQRRLVKQLLESQNSRKAELEELKGTMLEKTGAFNVCILPQEPAADSSLPKCQEPIACNSIPQCNLQSILDDRFPEVYPIEEHLFFQPNQFNQLLVKAEEEKQRYQDELQKSEFMLFKAYCEKDGGKLVEVEVAAPETSDTIIFNSKTYQCQAFPEGPSEEPLKEVLFPDEILNVIEELGISRQVKP